MKPFGFLGRPARYPLAPTLLRAYLLGGAAVLAVGFLLYFQTLTRRVEMQTDAMSEIVARFVMVAATTVSQLENTDAAIHYRDIMQRLDFPVILSDTRGRPMVWNARQVGVPDRDVAEISAIDLANPDPEYAEVIALQARLDAMHEPIPLRYPGTGEPLGFVHYGSPGLIRELRWTPWVAIVTAALFGLSALASFRAIKRAEQGFVWAGLAKETAHQMGTPISSLMGWAEVLRGELREEGGEVRISPELFQEVVTEIERDAERLNRVAARFSQIGSAPRLVRGSVIETIAQTVDYFRARLPREGSRVSLEFDPPGSLPEVAFNHELLSWVLENLIKNAINAADKSEGTVRVSATAEGTGRGVRIAVRDNGRGVTPGMERTIFRPGVSTRPRGWGLGLPLSQRIVTEYHGGRLDLSWTEPGRGAEFSIHLPAAT